MSAIINKFKSTITIHDTVQNRKERGRRVEYVRIFLVGCKTRASFCTEGLDISTGTLKNWENGYLTGLTHKGAKLVCARAQKAKVYCSPTWLMYGVGQEPTVITPDFIIPNENYFVQVAEELLVFCRQENTSMVMVLDDSMSPFLQAGDYVGGIFVETLAASFHGPCIVFDEDDNHYVCMLKANEGSSAASFELSYLNTAVTEHHLGNIQIKKIAILHWIRKV